MKTIAEQIEDIVSEMCDKYCKWPNDKEHDEDWLLESEDSPCLTCPLMRLQEDICQE